MVAGLEVQVLWRGKYVDIVKMYLILENSFLCTQIVFVKNYMYGYAVHDTLYKNCEIRGPWYRVQVASSWAGLMQFYSES